MRTKSYIILLIISILIMSTLAGCNQASATTESKSNSDIESGTDEATTEETEEIDIDEKIPFTTYTNDDPESTFDGQVEYLEREEYWNESNPFYGTRVGKNYTNDFFVKDTLFVIDFATPTVGGNFENILVYKENGKLTIEISYKLGYSDAIGHERISIEIKKDNLVGVNNVSVILKACEYLFGELDSETEIQVKQSYVNYSIENNENSKITIEDIQIEKYYGTYNNCVVVMFREYDGGAAQIAWSEVIDGIVIGYSDARRIYAWKDGAIYKLQEAFDKGFLTREALITITKCQIGLHPETEKQIKQTFLDDIVEKGLSSDISINDVWIESFYGCYSAGYKAGFVVTMAGKSIEYAPEEHEVTIADSLFRYNSSNRIVVWSDGKFYELQEAYDGGMLTKVNIMIIAYRHESTDPFLPR